MAVLTKRDKEVPVQPGANAHHIHTILGPESNFSGKLVFAGTVRLDGNFKGEIETEGCLIVGQSAHLEAQIRVGNIVINGVVIGDIIATQSVEIHAPGKVTGSITTPQLMIAKGVVFEGESKMLSKSQETASDHKVTPLLRA